MTTYRLITIMTTDTLHPRFVIMETNDSGQERVVSEHANEDDAIEYLGDLRDRAGFWRSPTE